MQNDTLVDVKEVSRWYGANCAVNNISFQVNRGEVLGFLGPNGAGKSTTMNLITGNLSPSFGEIHIAGLDLLENPLETKKHIGYLPEIPPLYTSFTVDEYLRFCAKLKGVAKANVTANLESAKQHCGLSDVGKRLINNLSKGFQQRVGIAQAIIHNPTVVILDEPTVGLDPIQISEIRQLIREIGKERSVILSSHILPEIQSTCDRVQIINQGKLVFHSSVGKLEESCPVDTLLVSFEKPPAASELESLYLIDSVELLDNHRFKIFFDPEIKSTEVSEIIVQASVASHWALTELTPLRTSLEQIFVNITSADLSENSIDNDEGGQAA